MNKERPITDEMICDFALNMIGDFILYHKVDIFTDKKKYIQDKLSEYKSCSPRVLFKTLDGKWIKEGYCYWSVSDDFQLLFTSAAAESQLDAGCLRAFSTEQTAKDWLLHNKPCLSMEDVRCIIRTINNDTKGKENRSYLNGEIYDLVKKKISGL